MNFQINDSVKIKSNLVEGRYFDGINKIYFNQDMQKYSGMDAVVVEIHDNKYELDIDGGDWLYNDALVEETVDFSVGDLVKISSSSCFGAIQDIITDNHGNIMYSLCKNNIYLFSKSELELVDNN